MLVLKKIRGRKISCFQSQKDRNPFNYDHANPHLSKAANYMSGGHPAIPKSCHYFSCHTLTHLSTHPNYPACILKGLGRSMLDVLIRMHPLPFIRIGDKWCRQPCAKPAESGMHCTYRASGAITQLAPLS